MRRARISLLLQIHAIERWLRLQPLVALVLTVVLRQQQWIPMGINTDGVKSDVSVSCFAKARSDVRGLMVAGLIAKACSGFEA